MKTKEKNQSTYHGDGKSEARVKVVLQLPYKGRLLGVDGVCAKAVV